MIFIANVLVMNGGTTFLIRTAREFHRRGHRCAILLLSDRCDPALVAQLTHYADIIPLRAYLRDRGTLARGLLGVFAPLAKARLVRALAPYGPHIHAMGAFGLIMALRLSASLSPFRITVGIYHQNEFLYRTSRFQFPRQILRLFASVPAKNIIFFNETSRDNYVDFYDTHEYEAAPLVPIGISIEHPPAPPPALLGCKILSIGNLAAFKTYNAHVIRIVAALQEQFPDIRYDIYGIGPEAGRLARLVDELGVADRVRLHGAIAYADMRKAVEDCDLFVGSGTALIEAAAVGRPAMIGIESITTPETYGYLSDVHDFSYNEDVPHRPKRDMKALISQIFTDHRHWLKVTHACTEKAKSFSVVATVDGFQSAAHAALPVTHLRGPALVRLCGSAVMMTIWERLNRSERFGDRRNQSYKRKR